KSLSPGLFSWGTILSAIQIILVCLFFLMIRRIVPSAGPIKGIQNRTKTISGFSFLILFPTLNQLNGLMEFISGSINKSSGGFSSEYCVLPGNKMEGYCNVKE